MSHKRKSNGIRNAIEMLVEDNMVFPEVFECLCKAYNVQIDFTEGRLAVKLDPSRALLQQFVDLKNRVLSHFTSSGLQHIGVYTCPGGITTRHTVRMCLIAS